MSSVSDRLKTRLYRQAKDELQSKLTGWINKKLPSGTANTPAFTAQMAEYFGQMIDSDDALKNGAIYDVSGEAQFMRFTAGASVAESPDSKDWLSKKAVLGQASANVEFDVVNATLEATMEWPDAEGNALTFYYAVAADGSKETTKSYEAGHIKVICKPSLNASVGATCALSTGLQLAVNSDGSCGMKGITPVDTDFLSKHFADKPVAFIHNDSYEDSAATRITPSKSISGIQGNVNLFAGVKAGGTGSVLGQWKSTDTHSKWVELFAGTLQGAVALGLGVQGDFVVTLHEGRLVIVLGLATAGGPGFSGKAGGVVDSNNIEALVKVLLKMVAQSGFRRVLFINSEQNGSEAHNDAFKYLNELLTAVFTSGMDIVLLATLSLKQLADINQQMLAKEYAQTLAVIINSKRQETWFDNALPETKGRLLWCLMQYPDLSHHWYEGQDYQNDVNASMAQRDAALNLIKWISRESHETGSRQYEEMLNRCNPQGVKSKDEFEKFQAYGDNWGELHAWFYYLNIQGHDNRNPKAIDSLTSYHQTLCPELNKHYHLYEYRREGYFRNPQDAIRRCWVYAGPLKKPLSMDERLQRLGISLPGARVIKEGI